MAGLETFCFIFLRRKTGDLFKYLTEIKRRIKAQHIGNLIHHILMAGDQFLGLFNLYG